MTRSTGWFLSYDLRPAKQTERGLLLDLLKIASDCGLHVRDYRYVGMGAIRFYDFMLAHRFLGISNMLSLEHDEEIFERAQFNVPFRTIAVRNCSSAEFLRDDSRSCSEVLWFDYDGGLSRKVTDDIASLGHRMQCGDFCFVTTLAHPTGRIATQNGRARLAELQEIFGELASDVELDDVQKSEFPIAVFKVLIAAFRNAFVHRLDGNFRTVLQVAYQDSTRMVTVGGAFLAEEMERAYLKRVNQHLPFLPADAATLYDIRSFNLTERERFLFDRAVTAGRSISKESNQLNRMGFSSEDVRAYKELIRYLPRYVEALV